MVNNQKEIYSIRKDKIGVGSKQIGTLLTATAILTLASAQVSANDVSTQSTPTVASMVTTVPSTTQTVPSVELPAETATTPVASTVQLTPVVETAPTTENPAVNDPYAQGTNTSEFSAVEASANTSTGEFTNTVKSPELATAVETAENAGVIVTEQASQPASNYTAASSDVAKQIDELETKTEAQKEIDATEKTNQDKAKENGVVVERIEKVDTNSTDKAKEIVSNDTKTVDSAVAEKKDKEAANKTYTEEVNKQAETAKGVTVTVEGNKQVETKEEAQKMIANNAEIIKQAETENVTVEQYDKAITETAQAATNIKATREEVATLVKTAEEAKELSAKQIERLKAMNEMAKEVETQISDNQKLANELEKAGIAVTKGKKYIISISKLYDKDTAVSEEEYLKFENAQQVEEAMKALLMKQAEALKTYDELVAKNKAEYDAEIAQNKAEYKAAKAIFDDAIAKGATEVKPEEYDQKMAEFMEALKNPNTYEKGTDAAGKAEAEYLDALQDVANQKAENKVKREENAQAIKQAQADGKIVVSQADFDKALSTGYYNGQLVEGSKAAKDAKDKYVVDKAAADKANAELEAAKQAVKDAVALGAIEISKAEMEVVKRTGRLSDGRLVEGTQAHKDAVAEYNRKQAAADTANANLAKAEADYKEKLKAFENALANGAVEKGSQAEKDRLARGEYIEGSAEAIKAQQEADAYNKAEQERYDKDKTEANKNVGKDLQPVEGIDSSFVLKSLGASKWTAVTSDGRTFSGDAGEDLSDLVLNRGQSVIVTWTGKDGNGWDADRAGYKGKGMEKIQVKFTSNMDNQSYLIYSVPTDFLYQKNLSNPTRTDTSMEMQMFVDGKPIVASKDDPIYFALNSLNRSQGWSGTGRGEGIANKSSNLRFIKIAGSTVDEINGVIAPTQFNDYRPVSKYDANNSNGDENFWDGSGRPTRGYGAGVLVAESGDTFSWSIVNDASGLDMSDENLVKAGAAFWFALSTDGFGTKVELPKTKSITTFKSVERPTPPTDKPQSVDPVIAVKVVETVTGDPKVVDPVETVSLFAKPVDPTDPKDPEAPVFVSRPVLAPTERKAVLKTAEKPQFDFELDEYILRNEVTYQGVDIQPEVKIIKPQLDTTTKVNLHDVTLTANYHENVINVLPKVVKSVYNLDGVEINNKLIAKNDTVKWVLSSQFVAGRQAMDNIVLSDVLADGLEYDEALTTEDNANFTISTVKDEKGKVVSFKATVKEGLEKTINAMADKAYTLNFNLYTKAKNDGAVYPDTFQLSYDDIVTDKKTGEPVKNLDGSIKVEHNEVTSNTVRVHTTGKNTSRDPKNPNYNPNDPNVPENDLFSPTKHNHDIKGQVIDGKLMQNGDVNYYHILQDFTNGVEDSSSVLAQRKGFGGYDLVDKDVLTVLSDKVAYKVLDQSGKEVTNHGFDLSKFKFEYAEELAGLSTQAQKLLANGEVKPTEKQGVATWYVVDDYAIEFYQKIVKKGYLLDTILPAQNDSDYVGLYHNQAGMIAFGNTYETNKVTNEIKPIDIMKDVVFEVGGNSIKDKSVKVGEKVLYRLQTDLLEAGRAYDVYEDYLVDNMPDAMKYTGMYKVVADTDFIFNTYEDVVDDTIFEDDVELEDGTVVKAGQVVKAGSKRIVFKQSVKAGNDQFLLQFFNLEDKDGQIVAGLSGEFYTRLSKDSDFQYSVYLQAEALKEGIHENAFYEVRNGKKTNEAKVTIKVEKPAEKPQPTPLPTPVKVTPGVSTSVQTVVVKPAPVKAVPQATPVVAPAIQGAAAAPAVKTLPQTGQESGAAMSALGLGLLGLATVLKRKKETK